MTDFYPVFKLVGKIISNSVFGHAQGNKLQLLHAVIEPREKHWATKGQL